MEKPLSLSVIKKNSKVCELCNIHDLGYASIHDNKIAKHKLTFSEVTINLGIEGRVFTVCNVCVDRADIRRRCFWCDKQHKQTISNWLAIGNSCEYCNRIVNMKIKKMMMDKKLSGTVEVGSK